MARERGTYGPYDPLAPDTRDQAIAPRSSAPPAAQDLVHTGSHRDRAIDQISRGFFDLAADLSGWLAANPNHSAAQSVAQWIAADVTPQLAEWSEFVAREKRSWWTKIATNWDTFEEWQDRLKQSRSLARAHGVTLRSPEPPPLPKTIWQRTEQGSGSEAMAVVGVLKLSAIALLGVMSAAGLYSTLQRFRGRVNGVDDRDELRKVIREELARSARKSSTTKPAR